MTKINLAYFITSHGFGHASRACAVMQAIQLSDPKVHFHIYTSIPDWFFYQSLQETFTLHSIITDIGLVQKSPFEIDYPATLEHLSLFYQEYEHKASQIHHEIKNLNVKIIISDISPLGITIGNLANIPAILIENFTWDWIYESYQTEFQGFKFFADTIRKTVSKANYHYLTEPFCQYPRSLDRIAKPITRKPTQQAETVKKQLAIPKDDKVILLSMGGIPDQIQINISSLEKKGITFIVPGIGTDIVRERSTIFLPHHSNFYHPNLVSASDAVIAKVGYSTIAEGYHAGVPMGYIPRPDFPESKYLSTYVKDKMGGIEIKLNEVLSGRWSDMIDQLLSIPKRNESRLNGADQIAEWILAILHSNG
jgi:uncharacterized protein (TIGR00661 family)